MRSRRGISARELGVVRDDEQRRAALAVELEEQLVDRLAGRAIEVAGRLVGEQQRRLEHHRARERHALLLAAGQLARPVREAVREADAAEDVGGASCARARIGDALDQRRHHHVLERGELGQQVMELEDEADAAVAELGEPRRRSSA